MKHMPLPCIHAAGLGLGVRKQRQRAPMASAMRLLPEYFPEELFGTSTRRWVLQVKRSRGVIQ